MSLPHAAHVRCEVGRYYMVPCVATTPEARAWWALPGGWVPVVGPKHRDAEHIGVQFEHWHTDWRFIHADKFKAASSWRGTPHSNVLTSTHGVRDQLQGEPVMRKLRCLRQMPDFPAIGQHEIACAHPDIARNWRRMEVAQSFTCNKLKPGNICPHRGIDLTPFEQADGTAICPGHGLRWNLRTGELMPRHAVEPAHV